MFTVGQYKDSLAGLLTGTNLNNVTSLNGAIQRAARILAQLADIPDSIVTQNITVYDGVYKYEVNDTIFGGSLIDFRPQGTSRSPFDQVYKMPIQPWDMTKKLISNGASISFEYDKGTPLINISSARATLRAVIDPMNATDGWTAAGSASGLTLDETDYYDDNGSLRFTLTGASTGTLTKTVSSLSIASYEDVGVAFLAIKIPQGATASNLTSIAIRLGSSATDYNEVSDTDGFLGAWVAGEWLLVALDFSTATQSGTPDWSALDYVQVRITHGATFTNFRVGGLWISLPSPYQLLYQSAAIFMASGANPSKSITTDNDQIVLGDAAYTIFEFLGAKVIALQNSGGVYTNLIKGFDMMLEGAGAPKGLMGLYQADNPSQEERTIDNYYG